MVTTREFQASLALCEELLKYHWDDPRMAEAMQDIMARIDKLPAIADRIRAERAVARAEEALEAARQRFAELDK